MSDELLIAFFRKTKEYCEERKCTRCEFDREDYCQWEKLLCELENSPNNWDIEKIERIIKE